VQWRVGVPKRVGPEEALLFVSFKCRRGPRGKGTLRKRARDPRLQSGGESCQRCSAASVQLQHSAVVHCSSVVQCFSVCGHHYCVLFHTRPLLILPTLLTLSSFSPLFHSRLSPHSPHSPLSPLSLPFRFSRRNLRRRAMWDASLRYAWSRTVLYCRVKGLRDSPIVYFTPKHL